VLRHVNCRYIPLNETVSGLQIVILHNAVTEHDSIADRDVLVQVGVVEAALRQKGHETAVVPCTLDLEGMLAAVRRHNPDAVFNLVESLAGEDSLIALAPAVLETFGIPYTGNRAEALFLTTHKLFTKQRLLAAGLPTPDWIEVGRVSNPSHDDSEQKWIVKGVSEHASRDMDDGAVFHGNGAEVRRRLRERTDRTGRPSFAERFIDGREINVALLACRGGVEVLPPEEIDFSAFPPEKERIVNSQAKWDQLSFEYRHTPARFDFPPTDRPLLDQLANLARKCWDLFSLRGWARVDFRIDPAGQPWILELNANACLSPDAGYAAALQRANISFEEAVQRIIEDV
jgi:D-alanine-D-alanine ligase